MPATYGYFDPSLAYGTAQTMLGNLKQAAKYKEAEYRKGYAGFEQLLQEYGTGQQFLRGAEQVTKAGAGQELVGRGLYGTTRLPATQAGIGAEFEEQRAAGYKDVLSNWAEYAGSYIPIYPGAGSIANIFGGVTKAESIFLSDASDYYKNQPTYPGRDGGGTPIGGGGGGTVPGGEGGTAPPTEESEPSGGSGRSDVVGQFGWGRGTTGWYQEELERLYKELYEFMGNPNMNQAGVSRASTIQGYHKKIESIMDSLQRAGQQPSYPQWYPQQGA